MPSCGPMSGTSKGSGSDPGRGARFPKRKKLLAGIGICVVSFAVALALFLVSSETPRRHVLEALPSLPDFRSRNEVLKAKVIQAHEEVLKTSSQDMDRNHLGSKIGTLGMLYQANEFFKEALSCYELAMELESTNPRWSYLSASIYQERGENALVLTMLQEAVNKAPGYSPAFLKLADTSFKLRDPAKAGDYYSRCLSIAPGDPYALLGLSRIAIQEENWAKAEALLSEAVHVAPDFGDAHRLLAAVYTHYGKTEASRKALTRADQCLRFHPAPDPWMEQLTDFCYDPDLLLVLGSRALAQLNMEKVLGKLYPRALELAPEDPRVHLAMGKALFMIGQQERARQFYEKAIALDPRCDEAYFQLGVILQKLGREPEAETMFLKALAFQPENVNVYNNLGVTRLHLGQYAKAIQAFEKSLAIYPEHIEALYNLGMALWAAGRSREAAGRFRQVLEMKPEWSLAANSLAWLLATDPDSTLRNGPEALKWALRTCEGKEGKNPEHLDTLAAAYAASGDFETARQWAREAIDLARQGGYGDLAEEVSKRLRLYEKSTPYLKSEDAPKARDKDG